MNQQKYLFKIWNIHNIFDVNREYPFFKATLHNVNPIKILLVDIS